MRSLATVLLGLTFTSAAVAEECKLRVFVNFKESAPKDQVLIRHESMAGWNLRSFTWTLQGSQGDLIFDTVSGGAGYNVAQPFEGAGSAILAKTPVLNDGDRELAIVFSEFPPSASFRFTLDVDDRISGQGGTMIDGNEIAGSVASAEIENVAGGEVQVSGVFDESAAAILRGGCIR